ncbi:RHS repeat-associated core domain-containing protein [Chitinolyticbacter albus]|uniref:RHS repeat-associated core domain-containing protein n=1 Tax=Chitinolyticbacter albus TaxID=2961951 RepID=UPI00210AB390|nr:RHS repeat-associated core domain-containing protein [Chitinolyticbacter albus]
MTKNVMNNYKLIAMHLKQSQSWSSIAKRFVAGLALAISALLPGVVRADSGLTVTVPNGYANISVEDIRVQSPAGPVRWQRKWDGQEWKFNPQWESLSQSWNNMTGGITTGFVGGASSGCSVWVDEDWQPSGGLVSIGGAPVGKMSGARSTPFNRAMGDKVADYPVAARVNVDYASLCMGGGLSSPNFEYEGFRRGSELYLGENNRFMFSSRSFLEKASTKAVYIGSSGGGSSGTGGISVGSIPLEPKPVEKGFRWTHKEGDWIEYDARGQVLSYGDKNGNTIWLTRDGDGRLAGAVDGNGRVAFSLHYTDDLLTEVRDYPVAGHAQDLAPRSVKYQYDDANRLIAVTDVRGNTTRYDYDNGNHIIKITDPEGRIEQIAYNGGIVAKRTAPDGGVTDYLFEYDDVNKQFISKITGPETAAGRRVEDLTHNRQGLLVRRLVNGQTDEEIKYDTGARAELRTNARGFTTRTVKNEFEQITQIDRPDGSSYKRSYSTLNLVPTEEIDELGVKTQYQYDGKGNLLKRIEAAGLPEQRVTEYVVNSQGRVTRTTRKGRTEANGTVTPDASWQIGYDALGLISQTTDPEGHVRHYLYDRVGNLVQFTDPRGNKTRFEVDADGYLLSTTDALGRSASYSYDKVGNLTSYVDGRGKAIQAAYDALNRLIRTTNQVGGESTLKYDAQNSPVEDTDEDGRRTVAEFDNFLRLTRQIDAVGNVTQYGYQLPDGSRGALYSPTEVKFPTFTQQNRFDQREQPTTQTTLNPNSLGTEGLVNSYEYDKRGQVKSETDANGKTRFYRYNAFGFIAEITDSLGNKTASDYDVNGNLLQITDAKGRVSRFEYDRNGRVIKDILPMGQTTSYGYDAAGNLSQRTDANGNVSRMSYDAGNRLVEVKQYRNGSVLSRTSTYTWDEEDNLLSWSDVDATRPAGQQTTSGTLSYDNASRKTRETVSYPTPDGAGYTLAFDYGYSLAGNKTSLTWPDGTAITYGYNGNGALETATIPGEGTISVNQFKWLAPAKTTLPGGTTQERVFDGLLNLEALKVRTPGQQTVLNVANSYGKVQELKANQRTDSSASGSSTKNSTFSYDDETRLTSVETDSGGLFGTETESFKLDAVGNRVAHSKITGAWVYDNNNRLLQRGSGSNATTYEYDEIGNLLKQTEPGNKVTQYRYDTQNRLTEVLDAAGKRIAEYGYDPLDRRVWKTQYQDGQRNGLNPANRTYYLYADEGLIAEAEQAIALNADESVSDIGTPALVTQYGPRPDSEFTTGYLFVKTRNSSDQPTFAYYHNDELGKPLQATDKAGRIVWAANYNVFGQATLITPAATAENPTIASNLRLPGQYADTETGLHYNLRRYYDPSIGRYITMDPVGLDGGINQYRYAYADPVNKTDPTGEIVPLVAGGVVVAEAYATCVAECMAENVVIKELTDECQNLTGDLKDCSLSCLLGPFGRLAKWGWKGAKRGWEWGKRAWDSLPCAINSFPSETLVHVRPVKAMENDAQLGKVELKPISELRVGDEVLAQSDWKDKGKSAKRDQRLSYEKITDIFTSQKQQTLVYLTLDNGEQLTATEGHPFKTTEGWRDAVLLKKGGKLLLKGSDGDADAERTATIAEVRTEQKTLHVFNLEVANAHTFFIGEAGLLVHNGKGCRNPIVQEAIQAGKRAHKAYKDVLGHVEQALENGMRPDSIDWVNKIVRELKPDTPSGIKKGLKQLDGYVKQLEKETGEKWQGFLDLYRSGK